MTATDIARELGVQFLVAGSVRRAGTRIRISAELVDAASGKQLWAQRYDRVAEDLFAVEDEVVEMIVATVAGRVEAAALERVKLKPPHSLDAHEALLRGKDYFYRQTLDDNTRALQMFERATEIDERYAAGYAWQACALGQRLSFGAPDRVVQDAHELINKARALNDDESDVHRILASIYLMRQRLDLADVHQRRALELNPNDDRIVCQMGEVLIFGGNAEEGVEWVERALRLNPRQADQMYSTKGYGLFFLRRYREAAESLSAMKSRRYKHAAYLAAALTRAGDAASARRQVDEVIAMNPSFSTAAFVSSLPIARDDDREHLRSALLDAGLPE